jgi:hypothetical protein
MTKDKYLPLVSFRSPSFSRALRELDDNETLLEASAVARVEPAKIWPPTPSTLSASAARAPLSTLPAQPYLPRSWRVSSLDMSAVLSQMPRPPTDAAIASGHCLSETGTKTFRRRKPASCEASRGRKRAAQDALVLGLLEIQRGSRSMAMPSSCVVV